jgi:hypothetical protein
MSSESLAEPSGRLPHGLDLTAIARRAALATVGHDPARFHELPRVDAASNAVLVTAESTEAALRTLTELNAAGYAATRGPADAREVVVTGWDPDRLELRTDCLAADVARVEAARFDEARAVLTLYETHLRSGGPAAEFARSTVDLHLRQRADDQIPEYGADADHPTADTRADSWEVRREADKRAAREILARRFGQWDRRTYQPGISRREAQALDPVADAQLDQDADQDALAAQVEAVAELEAAAEDLATRRFQVADEVLARFDALSRVGAPMPREQALDELRASIWSGADQAVHAYGSSEALWQARLDLLDDLRTEQQRAHEIRDLAAQQRGEAQLSDAGADASTDTDAESSAPPAGPAPSGGSTEAIERARRAVEGLHGHPIHNATHTAADADDRAVADDDRFRADDWFSDDEPRYDGEDWV